VTLNTSSYVLPATVDLRPGMDNVPNVTSQGIDACIAHSTATMYETVMDRNTGSAGRNFIPSRLYLYYWLREFEARDGQNGGYTKDVFEVLQNKGVCSEKSWPYDESKQHMEPPQFCDVEAQAWKIGEYRQLKPKSFGDTPMLTYIKHAVASGRPVVLDMPWTKTLDALGANKNWKTHVADPYVDSQGKHAVCVIGYDDSASRLLIQNSYGPQWGDGGFFGLEYKHLMSDFAIVSLDAFCVLQFPNFVVPVPAPGYVRKLYDAARAAAIRTHLNSALTASRKGAKDNNIPGDEIDAAMGWPAGTWDRIK
jgi:hypothetical protein